MRFGVRGNCIRNLLVRQSQNAGLSVAIDCVCCRLVVYHPDPYCLTRVSLRNRPTNRGTGATASELLIKLIPFYHGRVFAGGGPSNSTVGLRNTGFCNG